MFLQIKHNFNRRRPDLNRCFSGIPDTFCPFIQKKWLSLRQTREAKDNVMEPENECVQKRILTNELIFEKFNRFDYVKVCLSYLMIFMHGFGHARHFYNRFALLIPYVLIVLCVFICFG